MVPAALFVLHIKQCLNSLLEVILVVIGGAERFDDFGGPVDGVGFIFAVLVTEPEGEEGAIVLLDVVEIAAHAEDVTFDLGEDIAPGFDGLEGVGGDVCAGFIEWEPAPAAAEGGDAAVAVLQAEEPVDTHAGCVGGFDLK